MKVRPVVLAAALAAAVALVVTGGSALAGRTDAGREATAQAEEWLAANVQRDAPLVADQSVQTDLTRSGWPAPTFAPQDGAAELWTRYAFVLSTPELRRTPSMLAEWAIRNSSLVATFGDGDVRTDVLRVDQQGPAAARALDAQVRTASAKAARQLVTSTRVHLEDRARTQALDGEVDPRTLSVLVSLGAVHTVTVSEFANAASEGSVLGLLRQFRITAIDDLPVAHGPQTLDVAAWFDAQPPPYRAAIVGLDGDALLVSLPLAGTEAYAALLGGPAPS